MLVHIRLARMYASWVSPSLSNTVFTGKKGGTDLDGLACACSLMWCHRMGLLDRIQRLEVNVGCKKLTASPPKITRR